LQRTVDSRRYILGLCIFNLAEVCLAELQLRVVARPYLQDLVRELGLTAMLAVLKGAEAVLIDKVESLSDIGGGTWIGRHIDAHCTAQGKALIAHLSAAELEKILRDRRPAVFTKGTICSVETLKVELAEVRARGYAINDQEHVLGVRAD